MRNYRIDEANERQPQVLQVNSEKIRLYFDHEEVERDGIDGGEPVKMHVAKFVELPVSAGTDALGLAKAAVLAEITERDNSDAVNEFLLDGERHWIPREIREITFARIAREEAKNSSVTVLDSGDFHYEGSLAVAKALLNAVEDYATACYDVTQAHKRAVRALETVEDVLAYDYTAGYPTKLDLSTPAAE